MSQAPGKPYANTRLSKFVARRVLELRPKKTQIQIAAEAGFTAVNMLSMIGTGRSKLPLDRVPSLAAALEVDPRLLFQMALEQSGGDTTAAAIGSVFGTVISANEVQWVEELRSASGNSDPRLTAKSRSVLRGLFQR